MSRGARAVFAAPVYNGERYVAGALRSLLAQTLVDLAVVVVDDASTDGTLELVRELATDDRRLHVHVNPCRLGMLDNSRRAWALARDGFPQAEFVALASDHDLWDPVWLERLVGALEARPRAVLAHPLTRRIDASGAEIPAFRERPRCDTTGLVTARGRFRAAYRTMIAGDMIYGLIRSEALAMVGPYRPVLVPDRLLLSELALQGEFVQVPEVLWSRRFEGLADLERQRAAFWPRGAPGYARIPWWLVHAGVVAWEHAVRGKRGQRRAGAAFAAELLLAGARLRLVRRAQRGRLLVGRALERPTRAALRLSPFAAAVRQRRLPVPSDTQSVLDRLLAERERMER